MRRFGYDDDLNLVVPSHLTNPPSLESGLAPLLSKKDNSHALEPTLNKNNRGWLGSTLTVSDVGVTTELSNEAIRFLFSLSIDAIAATGSNSKYIPNLFPAAQGAHELSSKAADAMCLSFDSIQGNISARLLFLIIIIFIYFLINFLHHPRIFIFI